MVTRTPQFRYFDKEQLTLLFEQTAATFRAEIAKGRLMSEGTTANFGIVILAAGTSTRMGRAKQLLPWGETSLIRHVIQIAKQSEIGRVAVVVGANSEAVRLEIETDDVEIVSNDSFALGQGTSVHAGTRWAKEKDLSGVVFLVCDQPYLTSVDLQKIANVALEEKAPIVASGYEDDVGVPAFFASEFFGDLLKIRNDQGAKAVIRGASGKTKIVELSHALQDLDTLAEYEHALKSKKTAHQAGAQ
jgi:molybdenum cofactor cytidylyltransferase